MKHLAVFLLALMAIAKPVEFTISASPSGNVMTFSNPSTDNQSNQNVFVTATGSTLVNSPLGIWYTGSRWSVFNQNTGLNMPAGSQYNIMVPGPGDTAFVHTASAANNDGAWTYIDHPQLNGNPNARFHITQNWNPGGNSGQYNRDTAGNAHTVGIFYQGADSGVNKWAIYNREWFNDAAEDHFMTEGLDFNVIIPDGMTVISHSSNAGNISGSATRINDARLNGSPNAKLHVTFNWSITGGSDNPHPLGTRYDGSSWLIFNEDGAAMEQNAGFNVFFSDPPASPTITTTAQSPSNLVDIPITITFDRAVTGFTKTDLVGGNANFSDFLGSGSSYTVALNPIDDGAVSITVPPNVVDGGNIGASIGLVSDRTRPTLFINDAPLSAREASVGDFSFFCQFTEDVSGFTLDDLTLTNGTATGFQAFGGSTYEVFMSPILPGIVTASVANNAAFDSAGNGNHSAFGSHRALATAPVSFLHSVQPGNIIGNATILDHPSLNGISDIDPFVTPNLTGFGTPAIAVPGRVIAEFAEGWHIFSVDGSNFSNDGEYNILLPGPNDIVFSQFASGGSSVALDHPQLNNNPDAIFHINHKFNPRNGALGIIFDGEAWYVAYVDGTQIPAASEFRILIPGPGNHSFRHIANAENTNGNRTRIDHPFTNFNPLELLHVSYYQRTGPNHSPFGVEYLNNAWHIVNLDGTPMPAGATYNVSIATDRLVNELFIVSPEPNPTSAADIRLDFVFTQPALDFTAGDVEVNGGFLENFTKLNDFTYTASLIPTVDGDITVSVATGVASENLGTSFTITSDRSRPSITITTQSDGIFRPYNYIIEFSEPINDFNHGDPIVENLFCSGFNTLEPGLRYEFHAGLQFPGPVRITIPENNSFDTIGNGNTSATHQQTLVAVDPFDWVHDTVPENIQGEFTMLDNPITNDDPNLHLFATQFSEFAALQAPHGVQFINNRWGVFSRNLTAMPASTHFHLLLPGPTDESFVHVGPGAINHPALNNKAEALFHITHRWNGVPPANPHPSGIRYEEGTGRWHVVNLDGTTVPVDEEYNILIPGEQIHSFLHRSRSLGPHSVLDHPFLNNNPFAFLHVTQEGGESHPIGVTFDDVSERWQITNLDGATMANDTAFHVHLNTALQFPNLDIQVGVATPTNLASVPVTFTFTDNVTGFESSDVQVFGGILESFNAISGSRYAATIAPDIEIQDITILVQSDVALGSPAGGTAPNIGFARDFVADRRSAIPTITSDSNGTFQPFSFIIEFNEPIGFLNHADIQIENGFCSGFNTLEPGLRFEFMVGLQFPGEIILRVPEGIVQDAAGNGNTAGQQVAFLTHVGPFDFVHEVTPESSIGPGISDIRTPVTDDAFDARLFITPRANATPHIGETTVWFRQPRQGNFWALNDRAEIALPIGAEFNVLLMALTPIHTGPGPIEIPFTFENPNAVLHITHLWDGNGEANPHPTGLRYDEIAERWFIVNLDGTPIPVDETFNVVMAQGPDPAIGFGLHGFHHISRSQGPDTVLDHPLLNGNEFANVHVTSETGNQHPVGVRFFDGNWRITNLDGATMPSGIVFHVLLISPFDPPNLFLSVEQSPTNLDLIPVTFEFTAPVTNFDAADIGILGGGPGAFITLAPDEYRLNVIPDGDGIITVFVGSGGATGPDGSGSIAANLDFLSDRRRPTATLQTNSAATDFSPISYVAIFDEPVGFEELGIATNGAVSNFQQLTENIWSFDIAPQAFGTFFVEIPANVAHDDAGNGNTGSQRIEHAISPTAPLQFVHTVAPDNNLGDSTIVEHPFVRANPEAKIFATARFPAPQVLPSFGEGVWSFFHLGLQNLDNGAAWNVLSPGPNDIAFTHTDTANATTAVLDHPSINNNPDVIFHVARANNGVDTGLGLIYDGNHWHIAHLAGQDAIPIGSQFHVLVPGPDIHAYRHVAQFDFSSPRTRLDHPLTNGKPDAIIHVTSYDHLTQNNSPVGVEYSDGFWHIVNLDGSPIYFQATFNVLIVSPQDFIPTTISSPADENTNLADIPVVIDFAAAVSLSAGDLDLTNGSVANFAAQSATRYTADIRPNEDGLVRVRVPALANTIGTGTIFFSDRTAPEFQISEGIAARAVTPLEFTILSSEPVTDFAAEDLIITNGSIADFFAVSDGHWQVTVQPKIRGLITLEIPAAVAFDFASNPNLGNSLTVDNTAEPPIDSRGTSPVTASSAPFLTHRVDVGFPLNPHPVGVRHVGAGNYVIFNGDGAPLPAGADFNILVPGELGTTFTHVVGGPPANFARTTSGTIRHVSTAHNPTHNEYLVTWSNSRQILAQHIVNGAASAPIPISTSADSRPDHPDVAFNSTDATWVVVWQEDLNGAATGTETEIMARHLDRFGTPTAEPIQISDMGPDGDANFDAFEPAIIYGFTDPQFVVVWSGDDSTNGEEEIFAQRLDRTGNEIDGDFRISFMGTDGDSDFDAERPDIAWHSTHRQFLVVWEGKHEADGITRIYQQRINHAAQLLGPNALVSDDEGHDPAVAWNFSTTEALIVWESGIQLAGQLNDNASGKIGGNFVITNEGFEAVNPALSPAEDGSWTILYQGGASIDDFEIRRQRLAANLTPGALDTLSDHPAHVTLPAIAGGTGSQFAAWLAEDDAGLQLYTRHLVPNSGTNLVPLSHPLLDGNPNAVFHITHEDRGVLQPNPYGLFYGLGQWSIIDHAGLALPSGAAFNIFIPGDDMATWVHLANSENIDLNASYIDDPRLNDNPDAILHATNRAIIIPDIENPFNEHIIGVAFNSDRGRWLVFNADGAPIADGTAFNLMLTSDDDLPAAYFASTAPDPTNANPIPIVLSTRPFLSLTPGDLAATNASIANFANLGNGNCSFDLVPDADGEVSVGLASPASQTRVVRSFDGTGPIPSIAQLGPRRFQIQWSEIPDANFTPNSILISGATLVNPGVDFSFDVVPYVFGDHRITVPAGVITDPAGNLSSAASLGFVSAAVAPTVAGGILIPGESDGAITIAGPGPIDFPNYATPPILQYDANLEDADNSWSNTGRVSGFNATGFPANPVSANSAYPGLLQAFDTSAGGGTLSTLSGFDSGRDLQDVTWEFWLRFDDLGKESVIFETGGATIGSSLALQNDILIFTITGGNSTGQTAQIRHDLDRDNDGKVDLGSDFVHVICQIDLTADTFSFVINGRDIGSVVSTADIADWSGSDGAGLGAVNNAVGGDDNSLASPNIPLSSSWGSFPGAIAAFRIYEQILDATQISHNFETAAYPLLNAQPDAFVYAPGATVDYHSGQWHIVDSSGPIDVVIPGARVHAFRHVSSGFNTTDFRTRVAHPLMIGRDFIDVFLTQEHKDGIPRLPIAATYDGTFWNIENTDGDEIPPGVTFQVFIISDLNPVAARLTSTVPTLTKLDDIPIDIQFTADFPLSIDDLQAENATLANFASTSPRDYSLLLRPVADGQASLILSVSNERIGASLSFVSDRTGPQPSFAETPLANHAFQIDLSFPEPVTGMAENLLVLTNAIVTNFTETTPNRGFRFDLAPIGTGLMRVDLPDAVIADAAGNTSLSAEFAFAVPVNPTIDTAIPSPTNLDRIPYTITWDSAATGFTIEDLDLTNASAENLEGVDNSFSVDILPIADGLVIVAVDLDVVDQGNTDIGLVVTSDRTRPQPTILPQFTTVRSTPSLAGRALTDIFLLVNFSEPVFGFTVDDLIPSNASIADFSEEILNRSWSFRLIPDDFGDISVEVPESIAADLATNPNLSTRFEARQDPEPTTEFFVTGPVSPEPGRILFQTQTFDGTNVLRVGDLGVVINHPGGSVDPNGLIANVSLDFDGMSHSAFPGAILFYPGPDVDTYIARTGRIDDPRLNGNPNALVHLTPRDRHESTVLEFTNGFWFIRSDGAEFNVAVISPQDLPQAIFESPPALTNSSQILLPLAFDQPFGPLAASDFAIENAVITRVISDSPSDYTVELVPIADGDVTLSLSGNLIGDRIAFQSDRTPPPVSIGLGTVFGRDPINVTITADSAADLAKLSATNANISNLGANSFTLTPIAFGDFSVTLGTGAVFDAAGNSNLSAIASGRADPKPPTEFVDPEPLADIITVRNNVTFNALKFGDLGLDAPQLHTYTVHSLELDDHRLNGNPNALVHISSGVTTGVEYVNDRWRIIDGSPPFNVTLLSNERPAVSSLHLAAGQLNNLAQVPISVTNGSDNFVLTNATQTSFDGSTLTIAPIADGPVSVRLAATAAHLGSTLSFSSDRIAPIPTITQETFSRAVLQDFEILVVFSEVITGFGPGDIQLSSGTVFEFDFFIDHAFFFLDSPRAGPLSITVPAGAAKDAAGNPNVAATLSIDIPVRPTANVAIATDPADFPLFTATAPSHPAFIHFLNGSWLIAPPLAGFNLLRPGNNVVAFLHTGGAIDHPAINNNPHARLHISQADDRTNEPPALRFENNRWHTPNANYHVYLADDIHSFVTFVSELDHPLLNDNPNAKIHITQTGGTPTFVFAEFANDRWRIANAPADASFNVFIVTDQDPIESHLSSTAPITNNLAAIPFTLEFERGQSINVNDLITTNATIANFASIATDRVYGGSLQPLADGPVSIRLPAGPTIGTSLDFVSDRTAPVATLTDTSLSFSEPVSGLDLADFASENATVTLEPFSVIPGQFGAAIVTLRAGAVTDAAGNPNASKRLVIPGGPIGSIEFRHTGAIIDNPALNHSPNLRVFATPLDLLNPHPVAVFYDAISGRWTLLNLDGAALPTDAEFAIFADDTANSFLHSGPSFDFVSVLDRVQLNGNPDAIIHVTQRATTLRNSQHTAVLYHEPSQRWLVFNEDFSTMPDNAAFNVYIGGRSAMTTVAPEIDHPLLNDEAVLPHLTRNWSLATVAPSAFAAEFSDRWRINGADGSGFNVIVHGAVDVVEISGPALTNGTASLNVSGDSAGLVPTDFIIENGSMSTPFEVEALAEGTVTVRLPATDTRMPASFSYQFDATAPTARFSLIAEGLVVVFDEAVSALAPEDIEIEGGQLFTFAPIAEGRVYTFSLTRDPGATIVRIPQGVVNDLAGNPNVAVEISFLSQVGITEAYVHTATAENRESSWTELDHPRLNDDPNAVVLVSQRGTANPHPIGVQYVGNRWSILNVDQTIVPNGAEFTVFIPAIDEVTVLSSDTPEVADPDPDALYQVTQHWDGVYNPRAVGLQVTATGHAVFNQDDSPLLSGLKFNVAKGGDFAHEAAVHNIDGNTSYLDHPAINANPDAMMLISLNANPGGGGILPNNSPLALDFDDAVKLWRIVNLNGRNILTGTTFNLRIAALGGTATRDFRQQGATLTDSPLRGNLLALLFPTQLSLNAHPVGWRFDQVDWHLLNRDGHAMLPNLDFNVLVAGVDSIAFTHVANAANIDASWTYLDHPQINGQPNAILHIAAFGHDSPNPLALWYDDFRSQWAIQDQLGHPITSGAVFNVFVADNRVSAFTSGPNLDHPSLNDQPNAIVHVTQNWNPPGSDGVYNRHPIGLRYDGANWNVINTDGAPIPDGAAFNVVILDGGTVGGFSLGGQISYAGSETGPVIVELSTGATDSGLDYSFSGIQPGTVEVFAFVDVNGNGAFDDNEPSGSSGQILVPLQLVADVELTDPIDPATHWTQAAIPNTGFFPMTIIGSVRIDSAAAAAGVIVGAFVEGELRGRGTTDASGELTFDVVARAAGEPVTFLIYDGTTERMASHGVSLASGTTLGTTATPYLIDTGASQLLSLNPGWNHVSLFVAPAERKLRTLFPTATHVVSDSGVYNADLADDLNTLLAVEDGRGYYVRVDVPTSVRVTGPFIQDNLRIPLNAGWNNVGYTLPQACDLPAVLGGFAGDVFSAPSELLPGQGFWLDANTDADLTFANCASQALRCAELPSGAIHWYPGNNSDDFIGGAHASLEAGAQHAPGLVADAFRTNSGHVSVPGTVLDGLGDFSIEFWAQLDGTTGLLIDAGNALRLERQTNAMAIRVAGQDWSSAGFSRPAGQWHHIALIRAGDKSQLWIDTILFGESTVPVTALTVTEPWQFAANLAGLIDEFTVYDRALSRSDLVNIHTAAGDGKCPPAAREQRQAGGRESEVVRQPNAPFLLLARITGATAGNEISAVVNGEIRGKGLVMRDGVVHLAIHLSDANETMAFPGLLQIITASPGDVLGTPSAPLNLDIDANPPVAVIRANPPLGPVRIPEGGKVVFQVETNRAATLNWQFDNGPSSQQIGVALEPDFDIIVHPSRSATLTLHVSAENQIIGSWQVTIMDVDRPPPAPEIIIDNLAPRTTDSFSFTATQVVDPDGDAIFDLQGGWFRQRDALLLPSTSVQAADSAKGDVFTAIVRARTDPYGDQNFVSSKDALEQVLILNSPPRLQIDPVVGAIPGGTSDIQLSGSDPDGDPLTFIITEQPSLGSIANFDAQSGLLSYLAAQAGDDRIGIVVEDDSGDRSAEEAILVRAAGWFAQITGSSPLFIGMHPDVQDDLATGFRHEDEYAEWSLPVDASQASIQVSWIGSHPEGLFIMTPDGTPVDMRAVSSLTVGDGFVGELRIIFGLVTFELPIVKGWQLLSLPIQPLAPDIHLLASVANGVLKPVGRETEPATTLVAGQAYWVFGNAKTSIDVLGFVPDERVVLLDRTWSSVGPIAGPPYSPVDPAAAFTPPENIAIIWRWAPRRERFIAVTEVLPGRGYYIGVQPPDAP